MNLIFQKWKIELLNLIYIIRLRNGIYGALKNRIKYMIKEKEITVNITSRNITYYRNLNYNVVLGCALLINPLDLPKNSHQMITAICENCGDEKVIRYHKYLDNKNRQGYYGCKKCSNIKREQTSIDKWGVSNYAKTEECKNKTSQNNIEKYGVKTTLLETETMKKIEKTLLEKYDVKTPLSSEIIRNKSKKTIFKKYGVEHYSKTIDFYNKTYNRWKNDTIEKLERYNIDDYILRDDRTIDIKCDNNCDHYYNITSKNLYQRNEIQKSILCTICNSIISQKQSGKELQVLSFVKDNYKNDILENNKKIVSELDIYLPDLNLAFEFNGIYWHSDLYKDKEYHLNKTELCESNGIQLIHIWEDDWIYRQDIVKSMILNKLGKTLNKIYGRKTQVREVYDNELIRNFLNKNHLQGFVGSKVKLGLFYNDELVSLMTFGKRRISMGKKLTNDGEYELLRFCNKLNTNILGGASKLFKYFKDNYNPKEITTYADRCYSNGGLYEQLGFKFIGKTPPNYSYYDRNCNKLNRFNYRKDKLVKQGFDINKTEFQIMDELGYLRVFNSGNLKYYLNII